MALTYSTETYDTRDVDVVYVAPSDVILKDQLTPFDEKHLELALAETNLSDYTMPNGITADVYFAPFIRNEDDLDVQYRDARFKADPVNAMLDISSQADIASTNSFQNTMSIGQNDTELADHEARISALETP